MTGAQCGQQQGTTGDADHGELPKSYGDFLLLQRLGAGGMAEAFRAVTLGPQGFRRVLVVKRLLPELSLQPAFVRMIFDEATLSARLSHPSIVQIYGFGVVDDSPFLSMEYVPGRTVSTLMDACAAARRFFSPALVAHVARQVCGALQHAHSCVSPSGRPLGIIHRDISPANIMLVPDGTVKVLDFGIARADERREATAKGIIKGKIGYLAPEQLMLAQLDHRVDIFALGVVMHEMLTGRRLFEAESDLARLQAVVDKPIPPIASTNPAVTADLQRIVTRALERNPDRRYASAADMEAELEGYLRQHGIGHREVRVAIQASFGEEMAGIPGVELAHEERAAVTFWERRANQPEDGGGADGWPASEVAAIPLRETTCVTRDEREVSRRRHGLTRCRTILAALGCVAAILAIVALTGRGRAHVANREDPLPIATPLDASAVELSFRSASDSAEIVRSDTAAVVGRTPVTLTLARASTPIRFRIIPDRRPSFEVEITPDKDSVVVVCAVSEPTVRRALEPRQQHPQAKPSHATRRLPRASALPAAGKTPERPSSHSHSATAPGAWWRR